MRNSLREEGKTRQEAKYLYSQLCFQTPVRWPLHEDRESVSSGLVNPRTPHRRAFPQTQYGIVSFFTCSSYSAQQVYHGVVLFGWFTAHQTLVCLVLTMTPFQPLTKALFSEGKLSPDINNNNLTKLQIHCQH